MNEPNQLGAVSDPTGRRAARALRGNSGKRLWGGCEEFAGEKRGGEVRCRRVRAAAVH